MNRLNTQICWLDTAGDRWEKAGVKPGNIFEFHLQMSDDLFPGGLIETTGPEGWLPKDLSEVKRVLVRKLNGEEIEMPHNRPLVVAYWQRISRELC